jgi:hypothetical protein
MAYISEFDLEGVLGILNSIIEKYPEGSKERAAIKLAQVALEYPRHIGKEDDFRRHCKEVFAPSFRVNVSHEFATREEADEWLASGKAEHAEHVKIAGKGFLVVQLPGRMTFIDRPLPEEMETEGWEDDSE